MSAGPTAPGVGAGQTERGCRCGLGTVILQGNSHAGGRVQAGGGGGWVRGGGWTWVGAGGWVQAGGGCLPKSLRPT